MNNERDYRIIHNEAWIFTRMDEKFCKQFRRETYYKARIVLRDDYAYLYSYGTLIASIDKFGNLRKFWDGYSQTTLRHVAKFYNLGRCILKKEWESIPLASKIDCTIPLYISEDYERATRKTPSYYYWG